MEEEEMRLTQTTGGNEMNFQKKRKKKSVKPKLRTGSQPLDKSEDKIDSLGGTAKSFKSLQFTAANGCTLRSHTHT